MLNDNATAAILIQDVIVELSKLSRLEYEQVRVSKANILGIRVSVLDEEIEKLQPMAESREGANAGTTVLCAEIEPWPSVVDGGTLLDALLTVIERFIILPPGAAITFALWIVHTYAFDAAECTPYLGIVSPEKQCGKTRFIELIQALANKPLAASNITPAALFRTIEAHRPTLLLDEAETYLKDNEELRGVLNSGHRKATAAVIRLTGEDHTPASFSTWCPKAIALIGALPGTLEDRSIVIQMRRKTREEKTERLRYESLVAQCEPLRRQAARWVADYVGVLRDSDPSMPEGLSDRAQDCWRPLLAIADAAVCNWRMKARNAAVALSTGAAAVDSSVQVLLLSDIQKLFEARSTDRLTSDDIVCELGGMEDRPWPEWKNGKSMTKNALARVLGRFGVSPQTIRIGEQTSKGYLLEHFKDAFGRYTGLQSVTTTQSTTGLHSRVFQNVTEGGLVTDQERRKPATVLICDGVTDENPKLAGREAEVTTGFGNYNGLTHAGRKEEFEA